MDGGYSSSFKLCFAVKEHVHLSCSSGVLNIKKNQGPCLTFRRNPVLQKSFFFFFTFFFPFTFYEAEMSKKPTTEGNKNGEL